MLTPNEEKFIIYWEANRNRRKRGMYQLLVGLPLGLAVSALIIVNFYSGWYQRAEMEANGSFNPVILYLAAAIISVFIAFFSKKFQWEQLEQRYKELIFKKNKTDLPANAAKSEL